MTVSCCMKFSPPLSIQCVSTDKISIAHLPNKSDIICEFSCFYFSRMGCRNTVFSVPGAARRGSLR
jgi:hypothetical protein